MNIGDIMTIIAASVGGGGLGGFFIGKRRRNAEGESIEVDSSVKINREWERLYKEISEEFHKYKKDNDANMQAMTKRIDTLEAELSKARLDLDQERREVERLRNSA